MQGSDATKTRISTVFFARPVISWRLTACHRDAVRAYCGSGGRWFESTQLYHLKFQGNLIFFGRPVLPAVTVRVSAGSAVRKNPSGRTQSVASTRTLITLKSSVARARKRSPTFARSPSGHSTTSPRTSLGIDSLIAGHTHRRLWCWARLSSKGTHRHLPPCA